jgi:hypothetical protein
MDRRSPRAGAVGLRRFVWASVLSALAATTVISLSAQTTSALPCGIDLKLLVISADGREAVLPAITRSLDYLGTPYTLHIASQQPGAITSNFLKSGCRGLYQGIIQTSASLAYQPPGSTAWLSAITPTETQAIVAYATEFDVRQVNWYAFPRAEEGLFFSSATGTSATGMNVTFTAAGKALFPYLSVVNPVQRNVASLVFPRRNATFTINHAWVYLATATDALTVPLMTSPTGHVLAAVRNFADGREMLTMTFDGNPNLTHSVGLGYGLVNWVTRGLFIGERRIYASPQVDDLLLDNDRWVPSIPCGTPVDGTGNNIRMTGDDLVKVVNWQRLRRQVPTTKDLRLTMAYNGYGATTGAYPKDTLTPAVKKYQGDFYWVSHTFTHPMLDVPTTYTETLTELTLNQQTAATLLFRLYTPKNLVTPNVSGLENIDAMRAMYDAGVRYIVSDTSRPGYDNPSPNVGITNQLVPGVYMIPRRPNNLYFNVAAPADWVAEYNCMYRTYWGRNLTYAEILDVESQFLVTYLLRGEMDPWMFHQPNLDNYGSGRTLLTDLIDLTVAKYEAIYNLPILSPPMDEIGKKMQERGALRTANVRAFRAPDGSVTVTAPPGITVPITGLNVSGAAVYGSQPTAYVKPASNGASGPQSKKVKPKKAKNGRDD